jgi:hypothetical protein
MTLFNLLTDFVSIAAMLKKLKFILNAHWVCNNDQVLELDVFEL